jgi:hypothetical protein
VGVTDTELTESAFAVLNTVYLRKISATEAIADVSGVGPQPCADIVARAVADGELEDLGGMYMLSERGTATVLAGYRLRYSAVRSNSDVLDWYQRFETTNRQFLQAVSAWQTDDNGDPARLDRLLRPVERLVKALGGITPVIERYERYADRLRTAMDRVDAGDTEYVTSPTVDSLHNIWFEFHEDILTVLGRPRDIAEQAT